MREAIMPRASGNGFDKSPLRALVVAGIYRTHCQRRAAMGSINPRYAPSSLTTTLKYGGSSPEFWKTKAGW